MVDHDRVTIPRSCLSEHPVLLGHLDVLNSTTRLLLLVQLQLVLFFILLKNLANLVHFELFVFALHAGRQVIFEFALLSLFFSLFNVFILLLIGLHFVCSLR